MGILSAFRKSRAAERDIPVRPAQERLRRAAFCSGYVGDGEHLVTGCGEPRLLPAHVVGFLAAAVSFMPIHERLARYAAERELDASHAEALRDWLPALIDGGLLISERWLQERCAAITAPGSKPSSVAAIGIPTGDRLAHLERALRSLIENTQRHGRHVDFVVADGAGAADMRERTRELGRALSRQHGVAIHYAGWEEKTRFAQELVKATGCHSGLAALALHGAPGLPAFGANLNALALDQAWRPVVTVDDDAVCRITAARGEGLAFHGGADPRERRFFENLTAAMDAAPEVDRDFLALHEEMLGRDVGDCVPGRGTSIDARLDDADDEVIRRLLAGGGRVRLTCMGFVGDAGIVNSMRYLQLTGADFERLTRSEAGYRGAMSGRIVECMAPRAIIGDSTASPGFSMGLDPGALLPPFLPVMRGQDNIFSATLWRCFPDAFIGNLPWAILHDAPTGRGMLAPGDAAPGDTCVLEAFSMMLHGLITRGPGAEGGAPAMRRLGAHLREVGSLAPRAFEEVGKSAAAGQAAAAIAELEHLVSTRPDAPDFWVADVEHHCRRLRAALVAPDCDIPRDLRVAGRAPGEARRAAARIIRDYGGLLEAWPEISEAARHLRATSRPLAHRL